MSKANNCKGSKSINATNYSFAYDIELEPIKLADSKKEVCAIKALYYEPVPEKNLVDQAEAVIVGIWNDDKKAKKAFDGIKTVQDVKKYL